MLRKENTRTLCAFIFEELLCRWGPITEIVTDNAPAYKIAVDELARKYGIHPIHVSPYNSQANGIVERWHRDVREAIIKSCEGDETRWSQVVHSVFWAERVTIQKATGLSPYFMMHSVELIFPFDLAEATFLTPLERRGALTTTELIAWRAHQLQKRAEDLEAIRERVVAARFKSIREFERRLRANIKSHDFQPGTYVLVHNLKVEYELSKKTKLHYLGPMVVVRRTKGGSYMLAELDGAISKL
jgi:transposase InsO family protein